MANKYYLVMAHNVGEYNQSDWLYLFKSANGKIFGYSGEFEMVTFDIRRACSADTCHSTEWFGDDGSHWVPATLSEIRMSELEDLLVGFKDDMKVRTPIQPI